MKLQNAFSRIHNNSGLLIKGFFCVMVCLVSFHKAQSADFEFDEFGPVEGKLITSGYGGFQWSNFFIGNGTGAFANGIISPPCVALNGSGNPASISRLTPFVLDSAYFTAAYVNAMQIQVQGFINGAVIFDNTYSINATTPTLIHFNYTGVDRVTFTSGGQIFSMDNLSLEPFDTNMGCTFAVSPGDLQYDANAQTGTVRVFSDSGCTWEVVNTNSWVHILSGAMGTNSGNVTYGADANGTGAPRFGVLAVAGQPFAITQFAFGGTNTVDLGVVECSTIGHRFSTNLLSRKYNVTDFLINQSQVPVGGGVLANEIINFDENNRYTLKISAPPGKKFQIAPPPGQTVMFGGSLFWCVNCNQGADPNDYYQYGTLSVSFDGLEGTAPSFLQPPSTLSRLHGLVSFGSGSSVGPSDTIRFSSMTLAATVPNINTGQGALNYVPSGESRLSVSYSTSQASDPGPFVSLVLAPIPPTLTIQPQSNGDVVITFGGILEASSKVSGPFEDVPGNPQGTYTILKASLAAQQYFRARSN
jgi:hypothetical protein